MDWLDIDDLLRWCRENDTEDVREVLTAIGTAVELAVANHLDRPLFASQEALEAAGSPEHGLVVTEPIRQAARMLVSHLNEHRESGSELTVRDFPFGYDYLLRDYRIRSHP